MSEPLIIGQLRVCADCAQASPNGHTYLNEAARPMLKKAADEIERSQTALEAIAGFGSVNLDGEYEHGLRDIIRSMTDCAKRALNGATELLPTRTGE